MDLSLCIAEDPSSLSMCSFSDLPQLLPVSGHVLQLLALEGRLLFHFGSAPLLLKIRMALSLHTPSLKVFERVLSLVMLSTLSCREGTGVALLQALLLLVPGQALLFKVTLSLHQLHHPLFSLLFLGANLLPSLLLCRSDDLVSSLLLLVSLHHLLPLLFSLCLFAPFNIGQRGTPLLGLSLLSLSLLQLLCFCSLAVCLQTFLVLLKGSIMLLALLLLPRLLSSFPFAALFPSVQASLPVACFRLPLPFHLILSPVFMLSILLLHRLDLAHLFA